MCSVAAGTRIESERALLDSPLNESLAIQSCTHKSWKTQVMSENQPNDTTSSKKQSKPEKGSSPEQDSSEGEAVDVRNSEPDAPSRGMNVGRARSAARGGRSFKYDFTRASPPEPEGDAQSQGSQSERSHLADQEGRPPGKPDRGRQSADANEDLSPTHHANAGPDADPAHGEEGGKTPRRTEESAPDTSQARTTGRSSPLPTHDAQSENGPQGADSSPKIGRPREISSPKRTTVTLEERHVEFLDNTAARIKLAGGEKLSRGSLLRAFVEAAMRAEIDLSSASDEESVERILRSAMR